jgi:hypothetical protein
VLEQPPVAWEGDEQHLWAPKLAFSKDGSSLGMVSLLASVDPQKAIARDQCLRQMRWGNEHDPWYLARSWDLTSGKLRGSRFHWCPPHDPLDEQAGEYSSLLSWEPSQSKFCLVDPIDGKAGPSIPVQGRPFGQVSGATFGVHATSSGNEVLVDEDDGYRTNPLAGLPFWHGNPSYHSTALKLYDRRDGHHLATLSNQRFGGFSNDGRTLATLSDSGQALNLWDLPFETRWPRILAWAALPTCLIGLRWSSRSTQLESAKPRGNDRL